MKTKEPPNRQVRWALAQREKGLCYRCAKKRSARSEWFCDSCLKSSNNRRKLVRKLYRLKQLEKEIQKLQGTKKCK